MLSLGTIAPDFTLRNVVDDKNVSLKDFVDAEALLVVFTANHCPYAIHAMPEILRIAKDYAEKDLQVVAISSNDVQTHPDDGPDKMKELAERENYPFPYLYDETQDIARSYTAACTPDLFLFDRDRKLVYRGQLDDSRPGSEIAPDGRSLREALDQMLAGEEITVEQKPSVGCSIKWKNQES